MKRIILVALMNLLLCNVGAQIINSYHLKGTQDIVSKNYYFTYLLGHTPKVDDIISGDKVLAKIARHKYDKLLKAESQSERIASFKYSESEIEEVASQLSKLCTKGSELEYIINNEIIPSGTYQQFNGVASDIIKDIWRQDAMSVNRAISIYAGGEKPNYPSLDSIAFNVHNVNYNKSLLVTCIQNIRLATEGDTRFYAIPIASFNLFMDINDRKQGIDFEPLAQTENKACYDMLDKIDWDKYKYSAILVLGAGPEEANVRISYEGKLRSQYAAQLYKKGLAPFIILSGGRVHPYHTPYNEAYEMKMYMMNELGIPQKAIVIEPHARHTTTNVRNAGRILLRQHFPAGKYALITSSQRHIDSVCSSDFEKRCMNELRSKPYDLGERISDRCVEFLPLQNSFMVNPLEPIDP